MALSGYAVQVATAPAWRTGYAWAHGLSAGLFLLAYLGHLFIPHERAEPRVDGSAEPMV